MLLTGVLFVARQMCGASRRCPARLRLTVTLVSISQTAGEHIASRSHVKDACIMSLDATSESGYGTGHESDETFLRAFNRPHRHLVVAHLHRGGEGLEPTPGSKPMTTHLPATGWVF